MGFNPLEFSEILALCNHLRFGDWEIDLLERIDNAVVAAVAEKLQKPAEQGAGIPADDVKSLKSWAKGMATRIGGG